MTNQLAEQFQMLNGHIASAISDKDYTRAATLDRARQDMLKDICLERINVSSKILVNKPLTIAILITCHVNRVCSII